MNTFFAMSTLILSGGQVILGLAALAGAIYCGIFATKMYLNNKSNEIKGEHCSDSVSPLLRKYEEVDMQQHASSIKLVGTSSAVAIVLIVFAWTQFTSEHVLGELAEGMDLETLMDPPVTTPLVALPPPPVVKENPVVEISEEPILEEEKEEEKIEEETSVEHNHTTTQVTQVQKGRDTGLKKIVIEVEEEEEEEEPDEIITIADQMPRFPGCEDIAGSSKDKKSCSDKKLLEYIYANITYPLYAREGAIEGMAVISFVVRKDGTVTDVQILRDPGAGLGKEAARVVKNMKNLDKWTPGKHRGKTSNVRFNLPVKFKLN